MPDLPVLSQFKSPIKFFTLSAHVSLGTLGKSIVTNSLLEQLNVHCPNHFNWDSELNEWVVDEEGCDEAGDRARISVHASHCPYAFVHCPFEKHQCIRLRRKDLEEHSKTCKYRFLECPHCRNKLRAVALEEHAANCGSAPVQCPKCQKSLRQEGLTQHMRRECLENEINCPYGCKEVVLRKDLKKHVENDVFLHMEGMRISYENDLRDLKATMTRELRV